MAEMETDQNREKSVGGAADIVAARRESRDEIEDDAIRDNMGADEIRKAAGGQMEKDLSPASTMVTGDAGGALKGAVQMVAGSFRDAAGSAIQVGTSTDTASDELKNGTGESERLRGTEADTASEKRASVQDDACGTCMDSDEEMEAGSIMVISGLAGAEGMVVADEYGSEVAEGSGDESGVRESRVVSEGEEQEEFYVAANGEDSNTGVSSKGVRGTGRNSRNDDMSSDADEAHLSAIAVADEVGHDADTSPARDGANTKASVVQDDTMDRDTLDDTAASEVSIPVLSICGYV